MKPEYSVTHVAALMRHAAMAASYKPALLKALVRRCRASDELVIPLETLGDEFVQMYWNQVMVYRLRQASSLTKESEAIKVIRSTAERHHARHLSDLSRDDRARMSRSMARVLTINVLTAFHVSAPDDMAPLYIWSKGDPAITLDRRAHGFVVANGAALEMIANYHWAEFLESRNRLAPRIIQKVSRLGAKRQSLTPYLKIVQSAGATCFYCEDEVGKAKDLAIDHVIPWSFLLEDPIWDLVVACRECNGAKSDWLPQPEYMDKLANRNAALLRGDLSAKPALLSGYEDAGRLFEAALSVEWPHFWSP
jgi:hypothetical protein